MNIINISILKKASFLAVGLLALMLGSTKSLAQGPDGRTFGFGLVVFDPLGATMKIWTNPVNAFTFDNWRVPDFGPTRLDADYLWHFNAFNRHRAVKLIAGPGLAAFGDGHGIYGGREFSQWRQ